MREKEEERGKMTELLFCIVFFFILMSFTYHMHI